MMKRVYITLYKDLDYEWRWSMQSSKGEIIAESCNGYALLSQARENIEIVTGLIAPTISNGELQSKVKYAVEPRHFKRITK